MLDDIGRTRPGSRPSRRTQFAVLLVLLSVVTIAPVTAAVRTLGLGSSAEQPAKAALAPEPGAPAAPAAARAAQTLTWTASGGTTAYASAPTTAVAGATTIMFETSVATGNTVGMQHTLTFDTTTAGYNHDVDVNIVADPNDANQGHHEVQATLTPGKYRYFCAIPGHGSMVGEFTVTDGGGEDTTAPVVTAALAGTQDAQGNYVGKATATLTATDDSSGVASIEYALDTDVFSPYSAPVDVTAVGSHTLSFRATDNAGNTSDVKSSTFTVVAPPTEDTTPPEVTATVAGDKDAEGNYIGKATVTLAATDAGSGVDTVEYQLDGGAYTAYSAPVEVAAAGEHMLHYRATDKAGNVSEVGMASFTVVAAGDTTPPQVVAGVTGNMNADWTYAGSATVTLTATDADSGVASVEYSLDGAAFTAYTGPFTVTGSGGHTVKYRATDVAGNMSPDGTATFTIR